MPDAFLASGIRMRVIWTQYFTEWRADFVLAAAFFAVVTVFVKREPVVASAHVRANRVATFLLAAAVVNGAFVLVCSR